MFPKNVEDKIRYIHEYAKASNAATASKVDANSNVTQKTIAGLEAELFKPDTIMINRQLVKNKLKCMYDEELAGKYEEDLANPLYLYA